MEKKQTMELIQGTTPTIIVSIKEQVDLAQATQVWLYISQQNKVKVDKEISDVSFNVDERKIIARLSQDDTLGLKDGEAIFQIRVLLNNGTALATKAAKINIEKIYKDGVITDA